MKNNDKKLCRISKQFEDNLKKLYPYRSLYDATKELNKKIEEMLYGTKKPER